MTAKKRPDVQGDSNSPAGNPVSSVIAESPYVDVSWHQEFVDQDGGAIHSFEFKIPPASISKGEFVEFAFSNDKGRVIDVKHYIRDNMRPGYVEKPHLRHFIRIVLDTRSDGE